MKSLAKTGWWFLFAGLWPIQEPAHAADALSGSIAGRVMDERGNPLGGAIVRLEQDGWEIARTNTSPTGEYQLSLESTDRLYSLSAKQTDFLIGRTNLIIRAGAQVKADLVLRDDSSLVGRVVALDNSPLRDVVVQAIRLESHPATHPPPDLSQAPLEPGLMGEYFHAGPGQYAISGFVPEGALLSPTLRKVDREIDFQVAPGTFAGTELVDNFFVRWTGILRIGQAGRYTFFAQADDGFRLSLDGKEILNNGGNWQLPMRGEVELAAGDHALLIDFTQTVGAAGCQLWWESEGRAREIVPAEVLFHPHAAWPPSPPGLAVLSKPIATVRTDQNGAFRFRRQSPGRYEIRCHILGGLTNQEVVVAATTPSPVEFRVAPFKKGLWRTFTTREGLPANSIQKIYPNLDGTGMLWLGTLAGLSRFDGERSIDFPQAEALRKRVSSIVRQTNGILWLGTYTGLVRYHPETGKVETFTKRDGLPGDRILPLECDAAGKIWIGAYDGQGVAQYDGTQFKMFTVTNGLGPGWVSAILAETNGVVWFGTSSGGVSPVGGGVTRYDGKTFRNYTTADGLVDNRVTSICRDTDGTLWFGTSSGISHFDGRHFKNFTEDDGLLLGGGPFWRHCIHRGADGAIWIGGLKLDGTEGCGVWRYDGKSFVHFTTADGLPSEFVWDIQSTEDGVFWFAGPEGLARYDPRSMVSFNASDGLASDLVKRIEIGSDQSLWLVGSKPGVTRFDRKSFTKPAGGEQLAVMGAGTGRTLRTDPDGGLWVGTFSVGAMGLYRWDGARFQWVEDGNAGLRYVSDIEFDPDGTMWITCVPDTAPIKADGLWRYDRTNFHNVSAEIGLTNRFLTAVFRDANGMLWLGTSGSGVLRYDGKELVGFSDQNGLPAGHVSGISQDSRGDLWFSMRDDGVYRYDGKRFTHYTKANGQLAENSSLAVLHESRGVHWFASATDGLTRFDGAVWSTLDERDGLAHYATFDVKEDPPGTFWIGSAQGLTRYQPATDPPRPPRIVVKTDQEYRDLSNLPPITARERVIFKLGVTDFKSRPDNRLFRYRVTPGQAWRPAQETQLDYRLQPGWSAAVKTAQIEWTTNKLGTYMLEFQFIDRDLNYSKPTLAALTIVPPWYLNARIMGPAVAGNLGLLGVAVVSTMRARQRKREAQRLRERLLEEEHRARQAAEQAKHAAEQAKEAADEANRAKSQFLASMSHELRTPLNAIIGYSEMLAEIADEDGNQGYIPDLQKIQSAAKHQLGLVNDILDLSKIEAGKMTLFVEEFDVAKLVNEVAATVQPLVAKNGNKLEVNCPPNLGAMRSDQTKVRQVLFNLLSNASKFTKDGVVRLSVERESVSEDRSIGVTASSPIRRDVDTPIPPHSERSPLDAQDAIRFTVTDTGIGMTSEQLSKLFQAFTQAEASTSKKYGGTGLGLALSQRFCQLMGGDITVESAPGKGSTFTVTLLARVEQPK